MTSSISRSIALQSPKTCMTARQSSIRLSLFSIRLLNASRNNSCILCSYRWGVVHLCSPLNLALHCQTVRLYLLLECHTLEPKYAPQSPHFSLAENGLQQLLLPAALRCSISNCTNCHSEGEMMASWLPST